MTPGGTGVVKLQGVGVEMEALLIDCSLALAMLSFFITSCACLNQLLFLFVCLFPAMLLSWFASQL